RPTLSCSMDSRALHAQWQDISFLQVGRLCGVDRRERPLLDTSTLQSPREMPVPATGRQGAIVHSVSQIGHGSEAVGNKESLRTELRGFPSVPGGLAVLAQSTEQPPSPRLPVC